MNKKDTIEYILQQQQPDLLTIQDININKEDDMNLILIPGYKLELDQMIDTYGRARAGIYIKETIRYIRRKDLEYKDEAVVWIQLKLPGNKKILIQNYYRHWRLIDQKGVGIPNTESQKKTEFNISKNN